MSKRWRIIDAVSSIYVSQVRSHHVSHSTRPQRRRPHRGDRFYSTLFNTEPAKVKPGYANFAVAEPPLKLVLIENPGKGGSINHLGVEVESSETVHSEIARLPAQGCSPRRR